MVWRQECVLFGLILTALLARLASSEDEAVLKPGNDGTTNCETWCKSKVGGKQYSSCAYAIDTKTQGRVDCSKYYGYMPTYPPKCYCKELIWQGVYNGTLNSTKTATTTTKVNNCTLIHRACATCAYQRVPGTRNTDFICSTCASGWRLRADGIYKTCDCIPGMTFNSTGTSNSNWCVPCSTPFFCTGGSAVNPLATPSQCAEGLATISMGAKSEAQCYTAGGFGRTTTLLPNGTAVVESVVCPIGTYNGGGNTAGCQKCGPGLTTVAEGASSISQCVAPPGSYVDRGTGKLCQKGTTSEDFTNLTACIPCPAGFTTAGLGSNSSAMCDRVMPGYYIVNATFAAPCSLGSYQGIEGPVYNCSACPYGYSTRSNGAGGNAECLAPPGWELKAEAEMISECELGYYKEGWNKNPCLPCGIGLTTEKNGSVSVDQCRIKPGWGIKSVVPLEAEICSSNRYGDPTMRPVVASARCVPCSPNLFTMDTLKGENTTGYTSEKDCLLKPGWGLEPSGMVTMCPEGLFNEGYNREPCHECAAGYTSIGTGADSPTACVVRRGWALDVSKGIPKPCDAGSYSTGGTAENPGGNCTLCPLGYSTQKDESVSAEDCTVCAAGYGGANCTVCGYNSYSTGGQEAGSACIPCAAGAVSARSATDNTRCFPDMVDADNDFFPLSDDTQWTDETAANSVACEEACRSNLLCAMYRFTMGQASPKCQLLLEAEAGGQVIGFKADRGADYALYKVPDALQVGVLVSDAGSLPPTECMAACTASGQCELVSMIAANLPSTAGPCKLYGSELEPDWTGMYHIQGNRLHSDSLIAA